MLFLVLNVALDFHHVRPTHRKSCVSVLPMEILLSGTIRLHPLGTPFLDFFDNLHQGVILCEREQGRDMILGTADRQRGTFPSLEYAGLVGLESVARFGGNP